MSAEAPLTKLQMSVDDGVVEAKSYVSNLQTQVAAYDEKYQISETASSYLKATLDTTSKSIEELQKSAHELRGSTEAKAKTQIEAVQKAIQNVKESLGQIQVHAAEYDTKFKTAVMDAKDTVEGIASKTMETTRHALDQAHGHAVAAQQSFGHSILVATGNLLHQVEGLDDRFKVSETVGATMNYVAEKAKGLDATYHVSEKAAELDISITGGLGQRGVEAGKNLVHSGITYVSETVDHAKQAHTSSVIPQTETASTAPKTVDDKAP